MTLSRRELIQRLSAAALGAPFVNGLTRAATIQFGYASITWEGRDEQAIEDIASLGFRGIQLRANVVPKYGDRPAALRELLERRGLQLAAFSSGNLSLDPAREREQFALHMRHAEFVRQLGGSNLQIIDERPRGRAPEAADYERIGRLLTELGKRTSDLGIAIGYHPHMGSLGERPGEVRMILRATDARYVKLALDTAHYQQGGGDPAAAVRDYGDRLLFLHLKDLEAPAPGNADPRSYRFVELGSGKVDFKRVFGALAAVKFSGWAVVELDRVPDPARSPKESAMISKRYLEAFGFTI